MKIKKYRNKNGIYPEFWGLLEVYFKLCHHLDYSELKEPMGDFFRIHERSLKTPLEDLCKIHEGLLEDSWKTFVGCIENLRVMENLGRSTSDDLIGPWKTSK